MLNFTGFYLFFMNLFNFIYEYVKHWNGLKRQDYELAHL